MNDPGKTSDPEEVRIDPKAKKTDTKRRPSDLEEKMNNTKAKIDDDPENGMTDDPDAKKTQDGNVFNVLFQRRPSTGKVLPASYSHEEVKDFSIWIKAIAEFFGTFFLVLIGCGSTISPGFPLSKVDIAFTFGLVVAVMVQNTAHISGGHINPAVTASMLVTRNISIIPGCLYIVCQLSGAAAGAAILYGLVPGNVRGSMGVTLVSDEIEWYHALGIEILITFVLVFTVFSVVDPSRPFQKGMAPFLIGISVAVCHLWAIPFTGSSMNTARSFGPSLIMNMWGDHWVYWVGPNLGGVVAGVMYKFLFSSKPIAAAGV